MKKITNLENYVIHHGTSISDALQKISKNKDGFVIVVSRSGILIGSLTDGDVRRFLIHSENPNLEKPVGEICNRKCKFSTVDDDKITIKIVNSFQFCPIVDVDKKIVCICIKGENSFSIGQSIISEKNRTFIISEIGNNHNGSIELAKKMVDLSLESGADCVKFQMRNMAELYKLRDDASEDLGTQYTLNLLDKFQLKNNELFEVFDYCKIKGLTPLCTPWDEASLLALEGYGMEAYKVASADMTNDFLLEKLIRTNKPLIISTGMSTQSEIAETIKLLQSNNATYAMLHCNSTYPAPFTEINLPYISTLKVMSKSIVGYSGHERGIAVSIAAVAMGAKIIERHFTTDKDLEGNDIRTLGVVAYGRDFFSDISISKIIFYY